MSASDPQEPFGRPLTNAERMLVVQGMFCAMAAIEATRVWGQQTTQADADEGANMVSEQYLDGFATALSLARTTVELLMNHEEYTRGIAKFPMLREW